MYCWIEAESADEALAWGHRLLGDYYQKRFAKSDSADLYTGVPIQSGEIETNQETINKAINWNLPTCRIGRFPDWDRPWRLGNTDDTNK